MKRPAFIICCVAACAIGCATATSQGTSPSVTIAQRTSVARMHIAVSGGLPVEYEIEVSNPSDQPVTLTSVELETVGASGAYSMKRLHHAFDVKIAPHSVSTVPIRAWVQTLQQTDNGDVNAPVMLRGVARFDSAGGVLKTAFAARVQ